MKQPLPAAHGSGAMFDAIALRYDFLNRLMSFGLDRSWRKKLVAAVLSRETQAALHPDAHKNPPILDVATGTADVAIALAQAHRGVRVVGVDPSPNMLALGQHKVIQRHLQGRVTLQDGEACRLPTHPQGYLGATISFGIRNFPDRLAALKLLAQVVRPKGRIAILELNEPRSGVLGPLARWHVHTFVPWLGAVLSGRSEYRYLAHSIAKFPPADAFELLMRQAGLENVTSRSLGFGAVTLFCANAPAKSESP